MFLYSNLSHCHFSFHSSTLYLFWSELIAHAVSYTVSYSVCEEFCLKQVQCNVFLKHIHTVMVLVRTTHSHCHTVTVFIRTTHSHCNLFLKHIHTVTVLVRTTHSHCNIFLFMYHPERTLCGQWNRL